MKFPEPKNLRGALSPVVRACWIFGIGIFQYPTCHPRSVLSLCWSIIHLIVYLFFISIGQVPQLPNMQKSRVAAQNSHLNRCFGVIFIVTSMIIARKPATVDGYCNRIRMVNENLNKFRIAEDYGIIYKYQITQFTVAFAEIIIASATSFFLVGNKQLSDFSTISFFITSHYQRIVIIVVGCTYCGCIRYIGNRFEHLNAYLFQWTSNGKDIKSFLQELDQKVATQSPITLEIHGDLRLAKAADRRWTMHILRETRNMHHDLCIAAKQLNQAFGIQIIFFMAMAFSDITSLLFSIYQVYTAPAFTYSSPRFGYIISCSTWLLSDGTAVYYMVYCCSTVCCEAQRTSEVVQELFKRDISDDIQAEIDVFSLQLIQNPLQFTANGFFTVDYQLIHTMVGSVTTYLVIMIQMLSMYESEPNLTSMTTLMVNSTS